jgi:hypothetical protein
MLSTIDFMSIASEIPLDNVTKHGPELSSRAASTVAD